jgi:hypothetical protein
MSGETQSIIDQLSQATMECLQDYPKLGERHTWMLRALGGVKHKLNPAQGMVFLMEIRRRGGMEDMPEHEIQAIVDYCYDAGCGERTRKDPKWPKPSPTAIQKTLESVKACFSVEGV